ncbi:TPA: exonuclease [Escherichia coli]|nr:RecE family exodeoxyribonuclease [Escherichia coli]EEY9077567.1 exonuclease [Escherichia coli]EFY6988039.1 exonuclease [Escherichia coli]EHI0356978.1 exonuclease [Escherichia coli]EHJ4573963.1 exonuclease [Escherichia coli]EHM7954601.1 exonuclease [Escherichia coli]
MAEEKTQEYAYAFPVKNEATRKRLGFTHAFYWKSDYSQARVLLRANVAMLDAGFEPEDFKKPVRVNLPVVSELPAEGVFDTEFCRLYVPGGEDGKTMVYTRAAEAVADREETNSASNTNVNGEDMAEIEDNMLLPISGQELPIRWLAQHGSEKPVTHVSRDELQALHIARAEELPAITELAISHNTKLLDPLEIRDLHELVRDTDKVFPNPVNSSLGFMTAFFEAYLDTDYTDRGLLTKEWCNGNRISRVENKKEAQEKVVEKSPVTGERPRRSEKPTFRTINYESAAALCPGADCHDLRPVMDSAKKLMADDDERWRAWSTALGVTEGIKNWDRKTIFDMVSLAPSHIATGAAEARREWIENFLIARGVRDPDWAEPLVCGSVPGHEDNLKRVREAGKRLRKIENSHTTSQSDCDLRKTGAAEVDESKATSSAEIPDADKLLTASRGEYVDGISDPNGQNWVPGIQTRETNAIVQDSACDTSQESEKANQNVETANHSEPDIVTEGPELQENEPEVQGTEPEAARENGCGGCGKSGGGHCPDCGAVMGDNTYSAVYGEAGEATGDVAERGVVNVQHKVTADEVREIMKAVKPSVHTDTEESTEEMNCEQPAPQTGDNDDRSPGATSEDATTNVFDDSEALLHEEDFRGGDEVDVDVRALLDILRQQQVMLEEIRSTQARFTGAVIAMLSAISGGEQVSYDQVK